MNEWCVHIGSAMRISVAVDDALLAEAMAVTGQSTRRATVEAALQSGRSHHAVWWRHSPRCTQVKPAQRLCENLCMEMPVLAGPRRAVRRFAKYSDPLASIKITRSQADRFTSL
jgi:Bacterial antitoxin of type II TA system, VapB